MTRLDKAIARAEESSVWRYRGQAVEIEARSGDRDFSGLSREERVERMGPAALEERRPYVLEPRYTSQIEDELKHQGGESFLSFETVEALLVDGVPSWSKARARGKEIARAMGLDKEDTP